jgi:hypothetical protein
MILDGKTGAAGPVAKLRSGATFKVLHRAFVLLCLRPGPERAKVAALACLRVDLAGVKTVLPGLEFADHSANLIPLVWRNARSNKILPLASLNRSDGTRAALLNAQRHTRRRVPRASLRAAAAWLGQGCGEIAACCLSSPSPVEH